MRIRSMLFGAAVGAAIAYLFDPDRGRGRRTRLRDQAIAYGRRASERAARRARFAAGTAFGSVRELGSRMMPRPSVDDATLVDRVRSEALGNPRIPAGEINVDAADAVVTLRGELCDRALIDEVVKRVRAVPGVRAVHDLLHVPGEDAVNKEPAIRTSERASRSTAPRGSATE